MHKIHSTTLLSLAFTILFNLPIFFLKAELVASAGQVFFFDMLTVFSVTAFLFYILSCIPFIGTFLLAFFFAIGAVSNYFVFTFKKSFDSGVLTDILSVDAELVAEHTSIPMVLASIAGLALAYWLINKFVIKADNSNKKSIIITLLIIIAMAGVGSKGFHSHQFKYSIINYLPFNLVHAVNKYVTKHKKQLELAANKKDLTEDHKFTLSKKSDEPLTVVMVVGEAMRGDLISEEVTPLMFKRKNLVRFTYATSASTMTRVSIPYMLSSAVPPNYDQALGEKSIISIFKHLGFATSWIGSQGIFGMFETAFAPIALEADYRVIKNDLRKAFPGKIVCDECLVPFMKKRLGDEDGNQFMVLHFIGSHWNFSHRVPGSFNKRYLPSCEKDLHTQCSTEELVNGYLNTLSYSDQVLDDIITNLEDKNAIVIYAADHGYSLQENGYFGNGYIGDHTPRAQNHIAMFAWASEKFIKNNPKAFKNLQKHKNDKVSHDYIFHSLLDCVGVESDYIQDALSLCR